MESNKIHCSLICVGSELLRGKINTHASTLARRLASIGLELSAESTVGDQQDALVVLIRRALLESQVILVTGGLGPTFDDLTREAAAEATGRRLVPSRKLLRDIHKKFKKARYLHMPPANQRQADLLEGAAAIPNKVGTAPGQWLKMGRQVVILLPGPPSELNPMLENSVLPKLRRAFPQQPRAEAHLHFVGVPESIVDHKVRPIIAREKGADFTILAHLGLVDFDMFVSASTRRAAAARVRRITERIREKMGRAFYGMNEDYPLEKVVQDRFVAHRATLAIAESCTGGMLAHRLTDIPGSSRYFLGGVVSYGETVKQSFLNVPQEVLSQHGAVSSQAAAAMAEGARARMGVTWGLGITGIAGPGGATRSKPVGLVYIGLSGPQKTWTTECHFRGTRDVIRQRSVIQALDLLRLIYL